MTLEIVTSSSSGSICGLPGKEIALAACARQGDRVNKYLRFSHSPILRFPKSLSSHQTYTSYTSSNIIILQDINIVRTDSGAYITTITTYSSSHHQPQRCLPTAAQNTLPALVLLPTDHYQPYQSGVLYRGRSRDTVTVTVFPMRQALSRSAAQLHPPTQPASSRGSNHHTTIMPLHF
jgi:hypothetical protein